MLDKSESNLCSSNTVNLILCLLLMKARPRKMPAQGLQLSRGVCPESGLLPSRPAQQALPSDGLCLWSLFVAGSLSKLIARTWSRCLISKFPRAFSPQKKRSVSVACMPQLQPVLLGTAAAYTTNPGFPDLELPQAQKGLEETWVEALVCIQGARLSPG